MNDEREMITEAYRDFNARRIDAVLARLRPDVLWSNGLKGEYVHGHAGVRAYWTRQWATLDPYVEPLKIERDASGRYVVEVHQVVRDLAGKLLSDAMVRHIYQIRDGLVERMDIE